MMVHRLTVAVIKIQTVVTGTTAQGTRFNSPNGEDRVRRKPCPRQMVIR